MVHFRFFTSYSLAFTTLFIAVIYSSACQSQPATLVSTKTTTAAVPVCGAERIEEYLPLLKDKRVALLVNQTAVVGTTHLVDTLRSLSVSIQRIFAPEHGFRGGADAGEHLNDSTDARTGIPITSLYGNKNKPSAQDLRNVDVVIFDIQDVGARFYTFISSLHYLMQACAEQNKKLIVLDRPNPNGWYVDGPVLQKEFTSFVGVAPIPVVHGLTVGEYAQMVNGEGWLPNGLSCSLTVITCKDYTHRTRYSLPVKPSPNLPNDAAVYLYPSLCFFEGTDISVARGTDFPFQAYGSPKIKVMNFSFVPKAVPGAKNPPHKDRVCFGWDIRRATTTAGSLNLSYLLNAYKNHSDTASFFLPNNFFDKLAGTAQLRQQVKAGKTEAEIRSTWQAELKAYKAMRKKYLLYEDFE